MADKEEQSKHIQHGYEAARENKIRGLNTQVQAQADKINELWNLALFLKNVVLELEAENKELREVNEPVWWNGRHC